MSKNDRFVKANGNGQSQCYNCGCISWDSFMYIDTKYTEHNRLCDNCLNLFGKKKFKKVKIMWTGFKPYHRKALLKERLEK